MQSMLYTYSGTCILTHSSKTPRNVNEHFSQAVLCLCKAGRCNCKLLYSRPAESLVMSGQSAMFPHSRSTLKRPATRLHSPLFSTLSVVGRAKLSARAGHKRVSLFIAAAAAAARAAAAAPCLHPAASAGSQASQPGPSFPPVHSSSLVKLGYYSEAFGSTKLEQEGSILIQFSRAQSRRLVQIPSNAQIRLRRTFSNCAKHKR